MRSHSIQQKSAAREALGLTRKVLAEFRCMRGHARATVQEERRELQTEEKLPARNSGEHKIHKKRTKSFHSRVQPAGKDSRETYAAQHR